MTELDLARILEANRDLHYFGIGLFSEDLQRLSELPDMEKCFRTKYENFRERLRGSPVQVSNVIRYLETHPITEPTSPYLVQMRAELWTYNATAATIELSAGVVIAAAKILGYEVMRSRNTCLILPQCDV